MFTAAFWKAAGERATKTAAQTLIAVASIGGVFNLASISWTATGVAVLSASVLSLLSSLLSIGAGPTGSPSLVPDPAAAEPPNPAGRH